MSGLVSDARIQLPPQPACSRRRDSRERASGCVAADACHRFTEHSLTPREAPGAHLEGKGVDGKFRTKAFKLFKLH